MFGTLRSVVSVAFLVWIGSSGCAQVQEGANESASPEGVATEGVEPPKGAEGYTLTDYRSKKTGDDNWESEWLPGTVLSVKGERLYPTSVKSGRTYEQKGSYSANGSTEEFIISFILLENQPPQAAYLDPDEGRTDFIKFYSHWLLDSPKGDYRYFNLSQYIIDPDGRDEAGRASVRVRRMEGPLTESPFFKVVKAEDSTNDFWLRVDGNIQRILPRRAATAELEVRAYDEVQRRDVTVRIVRGR